MGLIEIVVAEEKLNRIYGRATHKDIEQRVFEAMEAGHSVRLDLTGIGLMIEDYLDLAELYQSTGTNFRMEKAKMDKLANVLDGDYLDKLKKGWQAYSKEFKQQRRLGEWLVYQEQGVVSNNRLNRLVKVTAITDKYLEVDKLKTQLTQPVALANAVRLGEKVFQREQLTDYEIGSIDGGEFMVLREVYPGLEQEVLELLKEQLGE